MYYESYAHRFADIILNSDYELKLEIEDVIKSIYLESVLKRFDKNNENKIADGKKPAKGKQSTINLMFREKFLEKDWELEKNVL